jgi:hypothetical protein
VAKPTKHKGKWRARWVDEHGRRQSAVFDDYRRAQTELSRRQVEVEEIQRGVRNAAPPEKTVGDLCDYWLENLAFRKRSHKDDESIIRRHLRPAFGTTRLRDVGVEDVDAYVNEKIDGEELSPKTVNNHVTLLGTMLRTAATFKVPWLTSVPHFKKPRVALFSRDFQWLRTEHEIHRFWSRHTTKARTSSSSTLRRFTRGFARVSWRRNRTSSATSPANRAMATASDCSRIVWTVRGAVTPNPVRDHEHDPASQCGFRVLPRPAEWHAIRKNLSTLIRTQVDGPCPKRFHRPGRAAHEGRGEGLGLLPERRAEDRLETIHSHALARAEFGQSCDFADPARAGMKEDGDPQ